MAAAIPEAVRLAAREGEPDRYLAALLAPPGHRADLAAVAALAAEIARIPARISEPMIGAIRLQWWRDAIGAADLGKAPGQPVADALVDLLRRHPRLPRPLLIGLVDASEADLERAVPADAGALRAQLAKREGVLLEAAWIILGLERTVAADALLADAGYAYGLARALSRLPHHLAHGGVPLPATCLEALGIGDPEALREVASDSLSVQLEALRATAQASLARVRSALSTAPRAARAAVLPLAMVEPYLRAQRQSRDHPLAAAEPSPLARAWTLWRAHRTGRL